MPAASTVTAQDINSEIGYTSTQSVNLDETRVRNLANDQSGEISFAQCRFGINVPGGDCDLVTRTQKYSTSAELTISGTQFMAYDGISSATSSATVHLRSNGQMSVYTDGTNVFNRTWLTSGSAGDYTIQFQRTSGDALTSGDSSNTDHALSSSRSFQLSVSVGPNPGYSFKSTSGNLILKDSGGTLITRPIYLGAEAEVSL